MKEKLLNPSTTPNYIYERYMFGVTAKVILGVPSLIKSAPFSPQVVIRVDRLACNSIWKGIFTKLNIKHNRKVVRIIANGPIVGTFSDAYDIAKLNANTRYTEPYMDLVVNTTDKISFTVKYNGKIPNYTFKKGDKFTFVISFQGPGRRLFEKSQL